MRWLGKVDPIITTLYLIFYGALMLTALAFIFEHPVQVPWTMDTIASELALGVICTASSYFGYFYLIKNAGAFFASFIFYFLPIFGLLEGRIFRAEAVSITQIAQRTGFRSQSYFTTSFKDEFGNPPSYFKK